MVNQREVLDGKCIKLELINQLQLKLTNDDDIALSFHIHAKFSPDWARVDFRDAICEMTGLGTLEGLGRRIEEGS